MSGTLGTPIQGVTLYSFTRAFHGREYDLEGLIRKVAAEGYGPGLEVIDRRVDHAPFAELIEQALGHFVRALILADLLAHEEDAIVGAHLFGNGVAQRLAHGRGNHLSARRDLGLRAGLGGRFLRPSRRLLDLGQPLADIFILNGAIRQP